METFGEIISAEACSGKGDSGFTEEEKLMTMMMKMMTRKLRVSGFSRGKLEAGRNELGLCTARYESKRCF